MTGPLVHIGYHKTGTNWFQRCLYPHVVGRTYICRPVVRDALLDVGTLKFDPEIAAERLGYAQGSPIVCEEELSGNIHSGGLAGALSKDLCARLYAVLPEATVVILIRNQVDMIASAYLQYIKEGGTHSVERYLQPRTHLHHSGFRQAKASFFSYDHFDYWPLIECYRRTFGADRVLVYPFERFVAEPKRFVEQFATDLQLDVDWDRIRFDSVNLTYRKNTTRLARGLNHFTYRDVADKRYWIDIPRFFRFRGRLLKAFNRTPLAGRKYASEELLGAERIAFIRRRYAAGNRAIARECGSGKELLKFFRCGPSLQREKA